ncbi:MAG: HI0074 family nucleotidyltransferase substrate-binding subunit [Patescibacteria group bacterium]
MASLLKLKIAQFESALKSLAEVLGKEKNAIVRDAAIQRFEYTVEIFWKMLKVYLLEKEGVEAASPKVVMREARNAKLLSDTGVTLALRMIDDRNLSTHLYNEAVAKKIFGKIPKYAALMKRVGEKLKK